MMHHPETNAKSIRLMLAVACISLVAFCYWTFQRHNSMSQGVKPQVDTNVIALPALKDSAYSRIETTVGNLRSAHDATEAREQLAQLRTYLQSLPPEVAAKAMQEFLDSKTDTPTFLSFKLKSDGFLAESPTVRVFLLDLLQELARKAAAAYSRRILETPTTPDEWAVALRNVAIADSNPETRQLLERKLSEMLSNEAWVRNPSVGLLESFDVAVHLGGTNLIPMLTSLARTQDNPASAHAAYLALDRLTISETAPMLSMLEANPDLMKGREETRANFFARADVREGMQRQLLEEYLLNPALDPHELQSFAGLFPNANYMVSHNLLTPVVTPDGASLAARDEESLRVVRQWLDDPRFVSLKPQLDAIQRRLTVYVGQVRRER